MGDGGAVEDHVGETMPVVVASKTRYYGLAVPSALNEEVAVVEIEPQADDYIVEGYIDLSQLVEGDEVVLREYIAVDGSSPRKFLEASFTGPVSEPVVRFHSKTILYFSSYKVTLTQVSGTLRSFPYAFVLEVLGTI